MGEVGVNYRKEVHGVYSAAIEGLYISEHW